MVNFLKQVDKPQSPGRRQMLMSLALAASLTLMGGAACSIGQPAQSNQAAQGGGPGGGGQGGGQGRGFQITPAPELPATQPDVTGLFLSRQDTSLIVGTNTGNFRRGNGTPAANTTPNGGTRRPPSGTPQPYSGPQTEIVTNSSTKFFKDVTVMNFQGGQGAQQPVQQQVQSVNSLDELIGTDTGGGTLTVWGSKNGDKVVATLVVYRPRGQRPQQGTPAPAGG